MQVGTTVFSAVAFSSSMLVCAITLTTFEHCNATELVRITLHNWSKPNEFKSTKYKQMLWRHKTTMQRLHNLDWNQLQIMITLQITMEGW
jgi:hypothetical protein